MKIHSLSIKLLVLSLFVCAPISANQDDWVLVDRFKRQLTAANEGKVKAMYDVGKLYERGRGINLDLALAAQWYEKAAAAGQTSAQSRLGIMYFEGRGVKQNYSKALTLLNAAAKDNVPSAQYQLANMYELGTGVTQNLNKAIHWYNESDKYGYYLAKNKIIRLKKILNSGGSIKRETKAKAVTKAKKAPSQAIQTITNGQWFKRKKSVGYLPSKITNCVSKGYSALKCISTFQERSTGSEIISYNTESDIQFESKNKFKIVYTNNVLEVEMLTVEDGDGNIIEQSPSRIKKGQQGRKRVLSCEIKNKNLISCTKGSSNFDLISR